ncbi:MAG: hypothetical protein JEZ03_10630, partial [Bacteroidales bacterium]|nr:hypothetical protein [Bacteroidales bacterium]
MKIKLLGFLTLSLITMLSCSPIKKMNQMKYDAKLEKEVLVGYCTRGALTVGEYGQHFQREYGAYQLNKDVVTSLKDDSGNLQLTIVLATWCHDSHIQVPRFFKVLDQMDFKMKSVDIICVD